MVDCLEKSCEHGKSGSLEDVPFLLIKGLQKQFLHFLKNKIFTLFRYTCVKTKGSSEVFLCEEGFVESLKGILGEEVQILGKVEGMVYTARKTVVPLSLY